MDDSTRDYILEQLRDDVKDIKKNYVTKVEFAPVRLLVFGIAGLMLSSTVLAVMAVVLSGKS